jgi:hypothetical protein
MLELKFATFFLKLIIQLQEIFNFINCQLNNHEILGFDIILVGGLILFSIFVLDMQSIFVFSVNAGKELLKKAGKVLVGLGTAASIYTGGKEVYKDINDKSDNSNTKISSNNNGNSNTNNSSKKT